MNEAIQKAIAERAKSLSIGSGDGAIELVRIEPGVFMLGSPDSEEGRLPTEGPVRKVMLTQAYYLGKCPITQQQYKTITSKDPVKPAAADVAIDQLTYADAIALCAALTKKVGVSVTLPTEAQWEYACRAGTTERYWSGNSVKDLAEVGWYRENADSRAQPVGKKPANPWGLHDMHGNVCEFCRDILPSYDSIAEKDPVGHVSETEGMMRGGAWMHPAAYCRSAIRMKSNDRFGGAGIRVAILA